MSFLFDSGDDGPSEAEILAKQVKEAEKRDDNLRNLAIQGNKKGVFQLLGRRNTSLGLPGTTNAASLSNLGSGVRAGGGAANARK